MDAARNGAQEAFVNSGSLVWVTSVALVIVVSPIRATAQSSSPGSPAEEDQSRPTSGTERRGLFTEPPALIKGFSFADRKLDDEDREAMNGGFYPELGHMVTGAGWISAGVGYRYPLFDQRALVEVSTAISWRAYKMTQARFELTNLARGHVSMGTQFRWQDLAQLTYYGEGTDSLEMNRSEYRLKSLNQIAYVTVQPREWLAVEGRVGWLSGPELSRPGGAFLRGNPATDQVFPGEPAFQLDEQPDYLYGETLLTVDTRDEPGYPTRGGFYRAAWSRYSDREAGRFSFQRFEGEAAHFVPLAAGNVVVALHGWMVATTAADGQDVPFYLMPGLGGHNTMRGFSDHRFHDRQLAVVNAETRVAIFEHIDAVAFVDAGNVAARWRDLDLDRTSYGIGVRVHGKESTYARLALARSAEGWQVVFRMNDPFSYSRMRKRSAQVPFNP
jgi:hypothetical protein